jgi:activating signal cointegrator 1
MKAITVRQPWASLIAAGVKTIDTRPRPTSYRGRVAIHAGRDERAIGHGVGPYQTWTEPGDPRAWACQVWQPIETKFVLPLGAVVASAVLSDCLPIYGSGDFQTLRETERYLYLAEAGTLWIESRGHVSPPTDNITDQLPFGDFTPGRWALLLDNIKPATDRCPWCWGEAGTGREISFCVVCGNWGGCDPVPARGQSAVPWAWQP